MKKSKQEQKHIIWSNMDVNPDDFDFPDREENLTDDEKLELAYETNDSYLDDERANLNIELGHPILIIADLGMWDGSREGYKVAGTNVRDIFQSTNDRMEWYADQYNVCATGIHHDGTNHYIYRELHKISFSTLTMRVKEAARRGESFDVMKYTRSIRPHVANVYGWVGVKKQKMAKKLAERAAKIQDWADSGECWF